MAAIEYGIDGNGDKTYPSNAYSGRTYICPYCFEEIHCIRQSVKRVAHFKHKVIVNRTPLQMMCPGYKGTPGLKRIDGEIDRTYITNGGIPLYLCEKGKSRYELKAIFPPLSEKTVGLLQNWNVKVTINEGRKREVYSAYNLYSYQMKSNTDWVKVQCSNLKYQIDELEEKWKWGIRGINPEIDIFHSNFEGGYRVALYSNVIVSKEYLIVSRTNLIPDIAGITFQYKGSLNLQSGNMNKEYYVYSMVVEEANSDAISFVQKRGYQLIEQSDEIIPMWPPAIVEGKELKYIDTDKLAYLFHKKRSQQNLYTIGSYGLNRISEQNEIFQTYTLNKTILLSEYSFHPYSNEIRVLLSQHTKTLSKSDYFKPNIKLIGEKKNIYDIGQLNDELSADGAFVIVTDYNVKTFTMCNGVIIQSSRKKIESFDGNGDVYIDARPYGVYRYKKVAPEVERTVSRIDYHQELDAIMLCKGPTIPVDSSLLYILDKLKQEHTELYQVIYGWIQAGSMPVNAYRFIEKIKEKLKNVKYSNTEHRSTNG